MKTWQVLLIFVTYVRHIFAVSSGVYIDNGRSQTVMQRSISRSEKAQFEKGLLALLRLPDKPSSKAIKIDLSASAPKFMLNLYNLMDGSDDKVDKDFVLTKSDYRTVEESDSIMTFSSENPGHHLHERMKRLWFNVSSAPVGDTVIGAELQLFRDSDEYAINSRYPLDITVTVFRVVKNSKGQKKRLFVDSKHVTRDFNGWLLFNVTSAFVSWVAFPSENYGLDISVRERVPSELMIGEMLPKTAGVIMTKYGDIDENILPFVVAFFKSDGKPPRRPSTKPKNRSKRKTYEPQEIESCERPYNWESMWLVQSCQIQSMYVDFKDLEWKDWVVAPQGYAAYFCSGECNFPLNSNMNATNHAIIQSLVHFLDPSQAPKPKCAPSQLGPMSLLYVLEDNSVTLKRFRNMVVLSCSCF